ncbi:MAG: hypothetical protein CMJ78_06385 [Planctomycetaceae bacterium]|nr:hypothetical protein [Planctomycetaceae bacterium]
MVNFAVGCLVVALLGAGAGWITGPEKSTGTQNPKGDEAMTLQQKYLLATVRDDEESWLQVIDHSSENRGYEYWQAKQSLGFWYLNQSRFIECRAIFKEFAQFESSNPQRAVIGHAGLASLAHRSGRYGQSQKIIDEQVAPLRHLLTPQMQKRLDLVKRVNLEFLQTLD